jgi:hypothetical protein
MKVICRLQEASKQVRLAKQEVEQPDISRELEQSVEALQNAMVLLDDD